MVIKDITHSLSLLDRHRWDVYSDNPEILPIAGWKQGLLPELFTKLHKGADSIDPLPEVKPEFAFIEQLHKEIAAQSGFHGLIDVIDGDKDMAGLAMNSLSKTCAEIAKTLEVPSEKEKNGQEYEKDIKWAAHKLSNNRIAKATLNSTMKAVAEDVTTISEFKEVFEGPKVPLWGNEKGQKTNFDKDGLMALYKRLLNNPKLNEIIKAWGKLKQAGEKAKANSRYSYKPVITGVEQGNDLTRLLPNSLIKLGFSKSLWVRDFVQESLAQYKWKPSPKDIKKASEGDAVILVDESGSMQGEPFNNALGIAIASLIGLKKANRKAIWALFSTNVGINGTTDTLSDIITLGKFYGGGTNFDTAIGWACNNASKLNKPDLVLITDGYCSLSSTTAQSVLATFGRIFFVFTNGPVAYSLPELEAANVPIFSFDLTTLDIASVEGLFTQLNVAI